eukprot:PhM_4_TR18731/c0_g1_i1/m.65796/K05678/ABCD4, PXMP1L; ATP-binding cassette, subfamily D (ALD), member 4
MSSAPTCSSIQAASPNATASNAVDGHHYHTFPDDDDDDPLRESLRRTGDRNGGPAGDAPSSSYPRVSGLRASFADDPNNNTMETTLTRIESILGIDHTPDEFIPDPEEDVAAIKLSLTKCLRRIVRECYPSLWSVSTILLLLQLGFAMLFAWAYNFFAMLAGVFASAVTNKDTTTFTESLVLMLVCTCLGAFSNACILYVGELLLMCTFRGNLVRYLHEKYFENNAYFRMVQLDGRLTDPDHRITHEVSRYVTKTKLIFFGTAMYAGTLPTLVSAAWFSYSLVHLAGATSLGFCLSFFFVFSVLNRFLMMPAERSSAAQSKIEADFAFTHTYFRLHAEDVAFLRGAEVEKTKLNALLTQSVAHARHEALVHLPLNFSSNMFFWGVTTSSYLIPGSQWWMGNTELSNIDTFVSTQTLTYNLLNTLSTLILLSQDWSDFFAGTKRIGELLFVLDELEREGDLAAREASVVSGSNAVHMAIPLRVSSEEGSMPNEERQKLNPTASSSGITPALTPTHSRGSNRIKRYAILDPIHETIDFTNVTLAAPGGQRTLLRNITFSVSPGRNVLIMGPSGIGKSSLLRALSGLWPVVGGTIVRPKNGVVFMPQKPYFTIGTLREQITYPHHCDDLSDEEAIRLLDVVTLTHLKDAYGVALLSEKKNWSEVLSIGEQQRLGIARIIYHNPTYAILDECTSAMDEDTERHVYAELMQSGISFLSVAHRSTVKEFHHRLLKLSRDGSYAITDI